MIVTASQELSWRFSPIVQERPVLRRVRLRVEKEKHCADHIAATVPDVSALFARATLSHCQLS